MKNGWTGGQYSIYRAILAVYLLMHFIPLLPLGPANPWPVLGIVFRAAGVVLGVFFGIGLYDRAAALALGCLWLCLFVRAPLLANPSTLLIAGLLLAHVFVPPAPYGSWAARGRLDPGGGWRMPPAIFAAAWIVFALGYATGGAWEMQNAEWGMQKENPCFSFGILRSAFCIVFAPLALLPRLRPWLWSITLMMQLALFARIDAIDGSLDMVMYHLFAFDPGWIRPLPGGSERLFYDGHCGLCQRSVRLILAEDATGSAFRFAPLQGETFASLLPAEEREALPLSMVVRTEQGELLTRSAGVLRILRRLGGVWRLLAGVLVLLPAAVRDRLYDGIARIRHRLFARPAEMCPRMPPHLRSRFDP